MSGQPRRPRGPRGGQFIPVSRPEASGIHLEEDDDPAEERRERRLEQTLAELSILFDHAGELASDGPAAFSAAWRTQGLAKNLLSELGETAARLPASYRGLHPDVEWHRIAGMRNRLVHEYQDTDYGAVWSAIAIDIPELRRRLGL